MSEPNIPQFELSKRETNELFHLIDQSGFLVVEFDIVRLGIENYKERPIRRPGPKPFPEEILRGGYFAVIGEPGSSDLKWDVAGFQVPGHPVKFGACNSLGSNRQPAA